jgi:hypothetical protein
VFDDGFVVVGLEGAHGFMHGDFEVFFAAEAPMLRLLPGKICECVAQKIFWNSELPRRFRPRRVCSDEESFHVIIETWCPCCPKRHEMLQF